MNVLIIYSHPNETSYNASILQTVQKHLAPEHRVKIVDLYKSPSFYVLMKGIKGDASNEDMKPYRDLLSWADQLIFIFPNGGGMPAILKGFIDRVLLQVLLIRMDLEVRWGN